MTTLFSLIESPFPPDFRALYRALGIDAQHFDSARKLHRALQNSQPDVFVGEFVYGWGNNYAGANVSNLDVTLRTLQCAAPQAKTIVLLQASEEAHVDKLLALFPVAAVLVLPVSEAQMWAALRKAGLIQREAGLMQREAGTMEVGLADGDTAPTYVPSNDAQGATRKPQFAASEPAQARSHTGRAAEEARRYPPLRRWPPR